MKKIIVDIDNTLWDFASVFYERITKVNPDFSPPKGWHTFDFWKAYLSPKQFYGIIRDIHMDQNLFSPYPQAESFLSSLNENDFTVIVASHREKGTFDVTARWLRQNNLIFDELHISNDKTILFKECRAIVDDSPMTLEKAAKAGIIGVGLRMPWNERENYTLFDSLAEVLQYLKKQLP
jgi:FMN phosphatase YigB (HAD superfamily)